MLPGDHIVRITSVRQLGGTVGASQITVALEVVTSTRGETPPGSVAVHQIKLGRPASFADVLGFLGPAVAASGLRKREVGSVPGQLSVGMALAWAISPAQPLTGTVLKASAVDQVTSGGDLVTVSWSAPAQAVEPVVDRMQGAPPAGRSRGTRSAARVVAAEGDAGNASRVAPSPAPVLGSTTKPVGQPELTTPDCTLAPDSRLSPVTMTAPVGAARPVTATASPCSPGPLPSPAQPAKERRARPAAQSDRRTEASRTSPLVPGKGPPAASGKASG